MIKKSIELAGFICGALLLTNSTGCSQNKMSTATRISRETWRADLDECRQVKLSCDVIHERSTGEPDRRYERLTLEVLPQEHLQFQQTLKEIELRPGVKSGQIAYSEVAIRSDEARGRVWFVDLVSDQVIATLDKETGVMTGPDEPAPAWATPRGGVLLKPAE